jgi:hypothetical protein
MPVTNDEETPKSRTAPELKVMYPELDINLLLSVGRRTDPAAASPYANGLPDETQRQLAARDADIFGLALKPRLGTC